MAELDVAPADEFPPGSVKLVTVAPGTLRRRLQLRRHALRDRGPLLARRRPALRGRLGRGDVPVVCPRHGVGVRPRERPPAVAARLPAGRDVSGSDRRRHRSCRRRLRPPRCWPTTDPLYIAYHDEEWGRPVIDERGLYERLCLEGFQSGLSWLTILRKRENFRRAFADFDPDAVARFGERDVKRLLGDAGIVRHRGKIEATIANARGVLELREAGTPLAGARVVVRARAATRRRRRRPTGSRRRRSRRRSRSG